MIHFRVTLLTLRRLKTIPNFIELWWICKITHWHEPSSDVIWHWCFLYFVRSSCFFFLSRSLRIFADFCSHILTVFCSDVSCGKCPKGHNYMLFLKLFVFSLQYFSCCLQQFPRVITWNSFLSYFAEHFCHFGPVSLIVCIPCLQTGPNLHSIKHFKKIAPRCFYQTYKAIKEDGADFENTCKLGKHYHVA